MSDSTPAPRRLLDRVNDVVQRVPSSVGECVRLSLGILASSDDADRKAVRVYGKIVELDAKDRDAAIAAIEVYSVPAPAAPKDAAPAAAPVKGPRAAAT